MKLKNLTDISFWEEHSNDDTFQDLDNNVVALFIKEHLSEVTNKTAFEIGCYPGNFIPTISRLGYTVSGVDFHPRTEQLKDWLIKGDHNVDELYTADFFEHCQKETIQYDLVYSLGLIEHFKNWKEVLELHGSKVKQGGHLVITCPNFRGIFQFIYHKIWDNANLKKHYLPSMKPYKWSEILENQGFDILYVGYFGGSNFWTERKHIGPLSMYFMNKYIKLVSRIKYRIPRNIQPESAFDCFCGLVAIKR